MGVGTEPSPAVLCFSVQETHETQGAPGAAAGEGSSADQGPQSLRRKG